MKTVTILLLTSIACTTSAASASLIEIYELQDKFTEACEANTIRCSQIKDYEFARELFSVNRKKFGSDWRPYWLNPFSMENGIDVISYVRGNNCSVSWSGTHPHMDTKVTISAPDTGAVYKGKAVMHLNESEIISLNTYCK